MARTIILCCGLLVGVLGLGAAAFTVNVDGGKTVVPAASVLSGVSAADARIIRDFYLAMADIVLRDGKAKEPVVKTVIDLRNRHKHALSMAFENTGMVGRYAGLGERLDQYLLAAVGDVDVPLTPELRQAAATAFSAIQ